MMLTPDALAEAILYLSQNPETAADMAEAALMRLRRAFGMDPGIARLSERLTSMMQRA